MVESQQNNSCNKWEAVRTGGEGSGGPWDFKNEFLGLENTCGRYQMYRKGWGTY
jgi:hypothetical protein